MKTSTLLATVLAVASTALPAADAQVPVVPIPGDPAPGDVVFQGERATPSPLASFDVPSHPFMAPNGRSNIHNDAYMTDAYDVMGPLGPSISLTSTFQVAECASVTFDANGRIVTVCVGVEGPRLMLLDPVTLETLAVHPLPPRFPTPGTGTGVFNDFSGGGYFYLDHLDRAVVPTNDRQIWVVAQAGSPAGPAFVLQQAYPLAAHLAPGEAIVSTLPDWNGFIWFAGTRGTVGVLDPGTGTVRTVALTGELIANSFAVDAEGVYVVTDHAVSMLDAPGGAPTVVWREPYDRGTRVKPGQVSQGSGTTPTLIGDDFVAITDNADPRMNVLVYRRARDVQGDRLLCAEPVFDDGRSATDNSLVAFGRSLIVENNYGYSGPLATQNGMSTEPGIARVDFTPEGNCTTVWTSKERSPSLVPKVSLVNGLLYVFTKDPVPNDPWHLTAIDARTGATVWKRLAGEGLGHNNNYAPASIGPDGALYVGVLGGLLRFADSPLD